MQTILVTGAGGAPAEGVINSLMLDENPIRIIGMGSELSDLVISNADLKYLVPVAGTPGYMESLFRILEKEKPDGVFFINDLEIYEASGIRDDIHRLGVRTLMPEDDVIKTCLNKFSSWLKWKSAGLKVPENILINNESDLKNAFDSLADEQGKLWLRSASIGGGGKGALPANKFSFAKDWIDYYNGWGDFVAAQILSSETVTWLSVWYEGELIVAQTRKRKGWAHGSRTPSGVTGVTKVSETFSDETVTEVSLQAIAAIDAKPNGIYGVDLTYDKNGFPNPTEINISRFFTTIQFFTEAGLNMPLIYKKLLLEEGLPVLDKIINPLPDGLLWMRAMDKFPSLMTAEQLEQQYQRI
ncbi:MAG: carboxylate--amine ligase [Bacteroidetes bacterium]|nr:carboxylate--amine ligase [Bacteroidota bacterium]